MIGTRYSLMLRKSPGKCCCHAEAAITTNVAAITSRLLKNYS
jgi:hypothetical protein